MLRFLFGAISRSSSNNTKQPWKEEADFFKAELPHASKAIQKLYTDEEREMPPVFSPAIDGAGNPIDDRRPGGHGYMLDLAEWHGMGYELEERFHELERECERWHAERSFLRRFVATCLWPCVPGLRALCRRRQRAEVWRCQVVELANHVAVLKTLLELERDLNARLRERNRRCGRTAA